APCNSQKTETAGTADATSVQPAPSRVLGSVKAGPRGPVRPRSGAGVKGLSPAPRPLRRGLEDGEYLLLVVLGAPGAHLLRADVPLAVDDERRRDRVDSPEGGVHLVAGVDDRVVDPQLIHKPLHERLPARPLVVLRHPDDRQAVARILLLEPDIAGDLGLA